MSVGPEFTGIRGIENTSAEFREKLKGVAARIGANARDLAAVIAFETKGTFSPSKRNEKGSGATGLIQFMPATARALGTTTEALARMSAVEQLDYVEKYLEPYRGRGLATEQDLHMAVLYPKAIGKGDSYGLFTRGTAAYRQNHGLDRGRDGVVTAGELALSRREQSANRSVVELPSTYDGLIKRTLNVMGLGGPRTGARVSGDRERTPDFD